MVRASVILLLTEVEINMEIHSITANGTGFFGSFREFTANGVFLRFFPGEKWIFRFKAIDF